MTSCSVLRCASRFSSSGETFGSGTPAICASRSTASGKLTPSVSMTKSKMLPFLPEEKSNQACFWSLTKNDGVFSLLNGDRPLNSRPERCSFTRRPTTSETGRRAFSSSRNWGVKRMDLRRAFGAAFAFLVAESVPYHRADELRLSGRAQEPAQPP